jgi:hypothetical protein
MVARSAAATHDQQLVPMELPRPDTRCVRSIMSVQSRHWLDYDPVALAVLLVGMSAVAFLALSI